MGVDLFFELYFLLRFEVEEGGYVIIVFIHFEGLIEFDFPLFEAGLSHF